MMNEKRIATRAIVDSAVSIVAHYERQAASGQITEAEAKTAALAALRAVRFGDQDYVWVNDMGIRPTVRGVAMNPIDHPHGGGEGRTGEGQAPVSPWNTLTKGYRTRSNKRTQTMIVARRKK